jgi:hypothetical protein
LLTAQFKVSSRVEVVTGKRQKSSTHKRRASNARSFSPLPTQAVFRAAFNGMQEKCFATTPFLKCGGAEKQVKPKELIKQRELLL